MFFEQIESEGLSHYSYIIGDKTESIVIDPRRDCDIYIEKAEENQCKIIRILETHRHEDFVSGSIELAQKTGAEIWHADSHLDYKYGKPVKNGQILNAGRLSLQAIHTPGHTFGSMSYLLHDLDGLPWIIFTGDTLFAGDTGRVDLVAEDRIEEMAGLLYESLFYKLLSLGDGLIVCPAHGAGSVCGSEISQRNITTIGLERLRNPKLQFKDKSDFIANVAKKLERPHYFSYMEKLNTEGAPVLGSLPIPKPLSPEEFAKISNDTIILDTRAEVGFGSAHIQNAYSIWADGIPSFAGWFLPYDKPLLLVNDTDKASKIIVRKLIRLGYDNIIGYLSGGMHSWHIAGKVSASIGMITVLELCNSLDRNEKIWLLDVRSEEELARDGQICGAYNIHITQLPERKDEIPKDIPVYIFCGTGLRAMMGASILMREGWQNLTVILGGTAGWKSILCPIKNK